MKGLCYMRPGPWALPWNSWGGACVPGASHSRELAMAWLLLAEDCHLIRQQSSPVRDAVLTGRAAVTDGDVRKC